MYFNTSYLNLSTIDVLSPLLIVRNIRHCFLRLGESSFTRLGFFVSLFSAETNSNISLNKTKQHVYCSGDNV